MRGLTPCSLPPNPPLPSLRVLLIAVTLGGELWTPTADGGHVFRCHPILLHVVVAPYCYRHAGRNPVAGSSADNNEPNGYSGHDTAANGTARSQWHSTRAASTAKSVPVSSTAELVRFRR